FHERGGAVEAIDPRPSFNHLQSGQILIPLFQITAEDFGLFRFKYFQILILSSFSSPPSPSSSSKFWGFVDQISRLRSSFL
ncbi:unnamed protein product, partial [Citrullus colocynthis]